MVVLFPLDSFRGGVWPEMVLSRAIRLNEFVVFGAHLVFLLGRAGQLSPLIGAGVGCCLLWRVLAALERVLF